MFFIFHICIKRQLLHPLRRKKKSLHPNCRPTYGVLWSQLIKQSKCFCDVCRLLVMCDATERVKDRQALAASGEGGGTCRRLLRNGSAGMRQPNSNWVTLPLKHSIGCIKCLLHRNRLNSERVKACPRFKHRAILCRSENSWGSCDACWYQFGAATQVN